jgi:hypothetical protein
MKGKNRFLYVIAIILFGVVVLTKLFPQWIDSADLAFYGLLLIITLMYAFTTIDILEDGKVAREIEFKQRQLEYFYFPLLHIMKEAELSSQLISVEDEGNLYYHSVLENKLQYFEKSGNQIYNYQYLSSEKIKEQFLKIEYYSKCSDEYKYENSGKILDYLEKFTIELESEIKVLNDKLTDLIKG